MKQEEKIQRIVNFKYILILVILGVLFSATLQQVITYIDNGELFDKMLFRIIGVSSLGFFIYGLWMMLIGLIKKINTETRVLVFSSPIFLLPLVYITILEVNSNDYSSLVDIAIFIVMMFTISKLAFIIRNYWDKNSKNKISKVNKKNKFSLLLKQAKYTRIEFFLMFFLPTVILIYAISMILDDIEDDENIVLFIMIFTAIYLLVWGLISFIRRGRDMGLKPYMTLLSLFIGVPLFTFLFILGSGNELFVWWMNDPYMLPYIPLGVYVLFFLLMPSENSKGNILMWILIFVLSLTYIFIHMPTKTTVINNLMWQEHEHGSHYFESGNWDEANEYCTQLVFDGYDDWRLPSTNEFRKLDDTQLKESRIFHYSNNYWTRTATSSDSLEFFIVDDDYNSLGEEKKDYHNQIRCVRGAFLSPTQDTNRSIWLSDICSYPGKLNDAGICEATWSKAERVCHYAWGRLPTQNELEEVILNCGGKGEGKSWEESEKNYSENRENNLYQSCYKKEGFNSSDGYWSKKNNYYIDFYSGEITRHYNYKRIDNNSSIRCIRVGD